MKKMKILLMTAMVAVMVVGCGKTDSNNENKVSDNNSDKNISQSVDKENLSENEEGETNLDENTDKTDETLAEVSQGNTTNNEEDVQKKNEDDTSIGNNTNEAHDDEKDSVNLNYLVYSDPTFGFEIKYPKELIISSDGTDEEGLVLTNEEGDLYIFAYGFNNDGNETIDSMKEGLMVEEASCEDIENGFILSYTEENMENKYIIKIGNGSVNAMIINYPSEKAEEYNEKINSIISNFKTGDLSNSY